MHVRIHMWCMCAHVFACVSGVYVYMCVCNAYGDIIAVVSAWWIAWICATIMVHYVYIKAYVDMFYYFVSIYMCSSIIFHVEVCY